MKRFILILLVLAFALPFGGWLYIYTNRDELCFFKHLRDAIKINDGRSSYYITHSQGKSRTVSEELIRSERKLLLPALILDIKAQSLINRGVPVICGDFVSMNEISPREGAVLYRGLADPMIFSQMADNFLVAAQKMDLANQAGQYNDLADVAYVLWQDIVRSEKATNSNFCMAKHVVESLGIAALHAPIYIKQSGGRAQSVVKDFIKVQILGLSETTLSIDKNAQLAQVEGVGIICNDVPHIPFAEEWEAKGRQGS